MNIKTLIENITLAGDDPLGRPARITFRSPRENTPNNGNQRYMWSWQREEGHRIITTPIQSSLITQRPRRLALSKDKTCLEVIEHITPLRWFGILGITLDGQGWPPYFGRSYEFYDALHHSLGESNQKVKWCTAGNSIAFSHRDKLSGQSIFTPSEAPGLHVHIAINYPGLGKYDLYRAIPEELFRIKEDMKAFTPGLPHWLYFPSCIGKTLGLWKHHQHVAWAREKGVSPERILKQFAEHRLVDLLGSLAFTHPSQLLAGTVESIYGGHRSDMMLVRKLQENLKDVDTREKVLTVPAPSV